MATDCCCCATVLSLSGRDAPPRLGTIAPIWVLHGYPRWGTARNEWTFCCTPKIIQPRKASMGFMSYK